MVEVLASNGLGYEISVPTGLVDRLPAGNTVELHTVLIVRDDTMELFGFESSRDRELFQRLRTVGGVGPRLALAVLGALPTDRVVKAIRGKDNATLQTVSGVGKKTAERIAIELADKLDDMGVADGKELSRGPIEAAVEGMRSLGYGSVEAEDAVRRAVKSLGDRDVETQDLVKNALQFV